MFADEKNPDFFVSQAIFSDTILISIFWTDLSSFYIISNKILIVDVLMLTHPICNIVPKKPFLIDSIDLKAYLCTKYFLDLPLLMPTR